MNSNDLQVSQDGPGGPGAGVQSPFVYVLNAMERAAQQEAPAEHGYAAKRAAVLEYVADRERRIDELAADLEAALRSVPKAALWDSLCAHATDVTLRMPSGRVVVRRVEGAAIGERLEKCLAGVTPSAEVTR